MSPYYPSPDIRLADHVHQCPKCNGYWGHDVPDCHDYYKKNNIIVMCRRCKNIERWNEPMTIGASLRGEQ